MDLNFDSEDYRAMFSNELALALRDIRAEYDAILEAQKGADNDSWYKAKVSPKRVKDSIVCYWFGSMPMSLVSFREESTKPDENTF